MSSLPTEKNPQEMDERVLMAGIQRREFNDM